jgi:RNA polymerase sigma-70 factor, ECF subfamily
MHSPPATDPDLVRGLQAGRRDAFERLYGEYQAPIYNLCARVLGDREEARDVTQDVFIKAFDQLPASDAESFGLRPWLYRVATNACFNVVRGRRVSGGLAEADELPATNDGYEQAQSVALIEQSLGQLNERYRAALVLKDLHGLDGEELAEVLEVSRPTADVLVHRARTSFKKAFAGLAGEGYVAPANLALALPMLTVPATLQMLPPLPAALAPPHAAVPGPAAPWSASPGPDPSSFVGPAGTGLLAKLAAAAGTKAAIVVGSAAVIAGGGLAVRESRHDGAAAGRSGVDAALVAPDAHEQGGAHDSWADHRHAVAEHIAQHARRAAHHAGTGAHVAEHHGGEAAHTGGHSSTAAAPHGADAHEPAPLATASTSTASTHHSDSGDTSASHDGDGEP